MRSSPIVLIALLASLGWFLPRQAAANPPLQLVKTMFPLVVSPGDTVTICLNVTQPSTQPKADIMWVLDVTGSMFSSIGTLQANINAFTAQLAGQGIDYQQGLYTFDDNQFNPDINFGFAANDSIFQSFLTTAAGSVGGGGDYEENGLDALAAAAANAQWRANASHTLILVTDAPVHAHGYDNKSPLVLSSTATSLYGQGFTIDTISSGTNSLLTTYAGFGMSPPGPIAMGDPSGIPALAGGQWLNITATSTAWNVFLAGLGTKVGNYTNVVLSDPLPPQLQPLPASSDGATIIGNTLQWTVSGLAPGQSFSHCVLTLVRPGFYGAVTNSATVDADGTTATGTTASPIFYVTYTSTATPTPTITLTPSLSPSFTVSQTLTISPTFTLTPTFTITPTYTPTPYPLTLTLYAPNPDPASAVDRLQWLPFALGEDATVDAQVWTLAGEPVRRWDLPGLLTRGVHETGWDLRNDAGSAVGSGVYVYRLRARDDHGGLAQGFGKCAVLR